MNIRHIETFLCVAECLNFRRAAEKLHRSQSAVSAHVQQLEEELGVPLLDRTTRRVSLTSEGQTLLQRCQNVVADLRSVAHELREASGIRGGLVSVGAAPSLAGRELPPILAAYQADYPRVTLRLHEAHARVLYEDVRQRVTDFAIGPAVYGLKDFDLWPILREPYMAVLPLAFPLRGRRTLTLKEFATQPLLCMPDGSYIRRVTEQTFADHGLEFAPKLEVSQHHTLFGLVAAGLGVTALPMSTIPADHHGRFQLAQLREPALTRDICIVKLKGKTLSPPARRLAELVLQSLHQSGTRGASAAI